MPGSCTEKRRVIFLWIIISKLYPITLKELKLVVIQWLERALPCRPISWVYPINNINKHSCPTHLAKSVPHNLTSYKGAGCYWVCRKLEHPCASWCRSSPTRDKPTREELSCNISMTSEQYMKIHDEHGTKWPLLYVQVKKKEVIGWHLCTESIHIHRPLPTFRYTGVKMGIFVCLRQRAYNVCDGDNLVWNLSTYKKPLKWMDTPPNWWG